MTDRAPAKPDVESSSSGRRRISAIWLIPIAAVVISLGIAWNAYNSRGPLIEIEFASAEGIVAGETQLKFRNFDVGIVETLSFTEDLSRVIAGVRLEKDISRYVDSDSEFWLVNARVGPQGISALSTVLSGAYIEGDWDAVIGRPARDFVALENPPLTPLDAPGTRIRLRSPTGGSVGIGAPILFKQIRVGRVEEVELTGAGDVMVTAFVDAPNDARLTTQTRFWNASGFSIDLSAAGASLRVDSIASLIQGGLAFDTINSGGRPISENHVFQVYVSENAARSQLLTELEGGAPPVELAAIFEGTISGLEPGADVQFHGVKVGEVAALQARVVEREDGPGVDLETRFNLFPDRLGIAALGDDARDETLAIVQAGIERGMRARLSRAGILSSALFIDIVQDPQATPATLTYRESAPPLVPTVPLEESDLMGSARGLVDQVTSLPIREVMDGIISLIGNVNALITDEEFRNAPGNIGEMISELRDSDLVDNINATVAAFRDVADQVAAMEVADQIYGVTSEAETLLKSLSVASDELPTLLTSFRDVSNNAAQLPLDELVSSATDLVNSTDEFVRESGLNELPPRLAVVLDDIDGTISDLRESGLIENTSATVGSLRAISEDVAAANLAEQIDLLIREADTVLQNVSTASEDLPALLSSFREVSDTAAALPLDTLVESSTDLVNTTNELLATSGIEDVPPRLSATLEQLEATLAELRSGGTVENVNATLASAAEASAALEQAAQQFPAIAAQLNQTLAEADAAIASFGPNSVISRELTILLTEARNAARAIESLTRELERRPNAVIFGR
ncbi:MAG: MlaD family protein [Pseudomonadota bacterium]